MEINIVPLIRIGAVETSVFVVVIVVSVSEFSNTRVPFIEIGTWISMSLCEMLIVFVPSLFTHSPLKKYKYIKDMNVNTKNKMDEEF